MSAEKETSVAVGFTPGPWTLTTAGNGFRRPSERHGDMAIVGASGVCPGIIWMSDNGERDGIMAEMRANARLIAAAPDLYEALSDLVEIIERAGISNLANGVQLGQMSWAIKAGDRMRWAKTCLMQATPPSQEPANPSPPHAEKLKGAEAPSINESIYWSKEDTYDAPPTPTPETNSNE